MAKQYGTVKVDFITFTSGTAGNESDVTLDVSGLSSFSQDGITITGDITARNITATDTLSGATITGDTVAFTTGTFSNLGVTGTITGDIVDFEVGAFITSASTSGYFPDASGTSTVGSVDFPFASGVFINVNSVTGTFTELRATDVLPNTDNAGNVGTAALTWANGNFTNLTIDSIINVRGAVDIGTNDFLRLGDNDEVEFFFNGTDFYLDLNSGGNNFIIRDGNVTRFTFDDDGDLIATRTLVANNFKETVFTISWSSSFALNPLNGETQFVVLGGNSTPTQSNWDNGESITLHIDDGSNRSINWNTLGVRWTGGDAPDLASSGDTVVQLWKAGNVIYGALVGEVA